MSVYVYAVGAAVGEAVGGDDGEGGGRLGFIGVDFGE